MAMRVVALLALLMMAGVHAADDANETAPEVLVAERDAAIDEHPQTNALGGESDAQSSTNNMVRNVQHRNAYLQKNQLNKAGTPTGGGLKAFGSSNKGTSLCDVRCMCGVGQAVFRARVVKRPLLPPPPPRCPRTGLRANV